MNIKPLADRIVIKPIEQEEVVVGGIVIPDTAKEKPQTGEVVAVGPGRKTDDGTVIPTEVKVGDKVLYAKYSGTQFKYDNVEYLVVKESEILAILD
ncbi:MAG: co-chaperone GroES [Bacillota bacterium]|jgi:chaperonin GroES|nr:co-chaperone GroES [Bacillota bacterium]NLU54151.1 co-chaperone GroES [Bacillota bacterium]HOA90414.1 co-chaperone GroES [Bacillota bacterium]HOL13312.1 co-chaperone GroES [Bacillota bacterium]HOP53768.1 co-chaperone GroES [Bacillota bacterium]